MDSNDMPFYCANITYKNVSKRMKKKKNGNEDYERKKIERNVRKNNKSMNKNTSQRNDKNASEQNNKNASKQNETRAADKASIKDDNYLDNTLLTWIG